MDFGRSGLAVPTASSCSSWELQDFISAEAVANRDLVSLVESLNCGT